MKRITLGVLEGTIILGLAWAAAPGQTAPASGIQTQPVQVTQASPDATLFAGGETRTGQAPVTPAVDHEVLSEQVCVVHLRPLYTTEVRLPDDVTSIAVGAPTLIAVEHSPNTPRLVFLKPTTHAPIDSNVVIGLANGRALALRVVSPGDQGSAAPVDFVVDFSQPQSLMVGDTPVWSERPPAGAPPAVQPPSQESGAAPAVLERKSSRGPETSGQPLIDALYKQEQRVATPHYMTAMDLSRIYPEDKYASEDLAVALGSTVERGDTVTVAYSVQNRSHRWIEILPPLLEFNDPERTQKSGKPDKKHPAALAEELPVGDYRMTSMKLAPGQRLDGAVQFVRPDFKYRREQLMLQIANASEVDTALLVPVPFISAAGQ